MLIFKHGDFELDFWPKIDFFGRLFLSLLAVAVYANLYRISPDTASALTSPSPSRQTSTVNTQASPMTNNATKSSSNKPSGSVCETTSSFHHPDTIAFSADSPVLTTVIEQPVYYRVHGKTVPELRRAILACPERIKNAGEFHAITARQLNWTYGLSHNPDGTCSLTGLHIGIHVAQLMPAFSPTTDTRAKISAEWNNYVNSLALHEKHHTDIAISNAQNLADQLQAIAPMRCELLRNHVQAVFNNATALMNSQDELYDIQTNHGATQRAVL